MSVGEVAGLLMVAVLGGGLMGVAVTTLVTIRRYYYSDRWVRETESLSRWLAARLTMSRAALSFVAAFRALAAEHRDSAYFQLRTDEAQRARGDWCEAMRELDRAEAVLITSGAQPGVRDSLKQIDRVGADALRRTINGPEDGMEELTRALRDGDQHAIHFVDEMRGPTPKGNAGVGRRRLLMETARQFAAVVDRWSESARR